MAPPRTTKPAAGGRPRSAATAPNKSHLGLWITLAVVVVAAAVTLGIAAAGGDGGDDDPRAQTAPVTVAGAVLPGAASSAGGATPDPALGMAAPVVEGTDFDGGPVSIGPGTGGPTLVVFVAHWCPHCRAEVPLLSEWIRSGQNPPGTAVVAVSTASDARAPNYPPSAWLAEESWPTPVLRDDPAGTAAQAYGLSQFPYFVLLDGDGTVVDRFAGEISMTDLEARIISGVA